MEHFFPPNSRGDLRSDVHRNQIFGRDADEDHTQIIGRDHRRSQGGGPGGPGPPQSKLH